MYRVRSRVLTAVGAASLGASVAFAGTTAATSITEPEPGAVEILPPDESYAGVTLGEWGARWWQWTLSLPADINPGFDDTGASCGHGQFGPVFFLPVGAGGTTWESPCVVAEGTAMYVTVGARVCSTVEDPPYYGADEDELRTCVETYPSAPSMSLHASVNGQEVAELETHRTVTPLFTLTLGEDNNLGVAPGVAQAMGLEYAFIIAPPPPGDYVVDVSASFEGQRIIDYTVNVTVEAPQIIEPTGSEGSSGT